LSRIRPHKPKVTTLQSNIVRVDLRHGAPVAAERIRGGRLKTIRERVALRAGYCCEICGQVTRLAIGEVDHVVPLHLGGQETDNNRQFLCVSCHKAKSEREERGRNG
jgi:5-methylcytosine-specific restriction protein A